MERSYSLNIMILVAFVANILGPLPAVCAQDTSLPNPGQMLNLSAKFSPAILSGIKIYPDNPLEFDFILEKGDSNPNNEDYKETSRRLIRYFLAALTVPEKDLWVNLSPYEKDRIVPEAFGVTEMGRDLLTQDYLLKQLTSSLLYPEDEIGVKFWNRMKELAHKKFGISDVSTNTFNKVWVVPEKAVIYENAKAGTAYIVESRLKVMLEEDYLALDQNVSPEDKKTDSHTAASQIVREIIIPELTKEINENTHFAKLRQIYNSYILATWYKQKIKDSILTQVYNDKNKVAGIDIPDPDEKEKIYRQYLEAFKKGAYNYIREEYDPSSEEMIPRKYFSGGFQLAWKGSSALTTTNRIPDRLRQSFRAGLGGLSIVVAGLAPQSIIPPPTPLPVKEAKGKLGGDGQIGSVLTVNNPVKDKPLISEEQSLISSVQEQNIAIITKNLGFFGNTNDEDIAKEIYTFFQGLEAEFTKHLATPVTLTITQTDELLYGDKPATPMPGILFTYHVGDGPVNDQNMIGRFMINRKPGERTYILSGLLSRDISNPQKKVVVTAYTNNYDHLKTETLKELEDLREILSRDNILGKANLDTLLSTVLSEQDKNLFTLIYRDKGEDFYNQILQNMHTTGKSFHDSVNTLIGGQEYEFLGSIIKLLARAAGSLTVEQIESMQFTDKTNLEAIIKAFTSQERMNTPSQKYPINPAVTLSLFTGAKMIKNLAVKWGITLEADVAIPDGLPNITFYQKLGFEIDPGSDMLQLFEEFNELRKRYKKKGQIINLAQMTWTLYNGHKLGKMTFVPPRAKLDTAITPNSQNDSPGAVVPLSQRAASAVGGINFNPDKLFLVIQNSDGEIELTPNPLILQELKNATGFDPFILDIRPMQNLQLFLGINPAAN